MVTYVSQLPAMATEANTSVRQVRRSAVRSSRQPLVLLSSALMNTDVHTIRCARISSGPAGWRSGK